MNMPHPIALIGTLLVGYGFCIVGYCYSFTDVQDLKKDLFIVKAYDKTIRPILNQSRAIEVSLKGFLMCASVIVTKLLVIIIFINKQT